ncbi:hypothetical protein [Halorussus salinisoli]|uniref:hypothetical protein n=1 Tax=Halorussus salinisoli TaxID=2558242 RepID=UPI0010C20E56|nr:hypothetical protein [Halorussus salinisoli]
MWQDIVILAGSIVAIASLFPTLLDENASVPHSTSVPTLVVLSGQGVAFYSLGLMGSALGAGAGFVVWSLIAYYKAPDDSAVSESVSEPTPDHAPDASSRTTGAQPHAD